MFHRALYALKLRNDSDLFVVGSKHAGEWHSDSWLPTDTIYGMVALMF